MGLYQKYRPKTFTAVVGNEHVVESIQKLISDPDNAPHSFLLHGPTGCGKTTVARIIASELGVNEFNLQELDTADVRGIDTIREIRKQALYKSMGGMYRVFILDECHKLTNDAQNALLKILEDTPSHVYFILCTTDPNKLIKTIRGRCVEFGMSKLNEDEMHRLLQRIIRKERQEVEDKVLDKIIERSEGHPRNAINILEQVFSVEPDQQITIIERSIEEETLSIELCRALINRNGWGKVREILAGLSDKDAESIRRHVLGYCQSVLLKADNPTAGLVMEFMIDPFYDSGFPGLVFACYSIVRS